MGGKALDMAEKHANHQFDNVYDSSSRSSGLMIHGLTLIQGW